MELKLLLIQNNAIIGNKLATFNNIEKLVNKHQDKDFDLLILPEVFSIGWLCENFKKDAETLENSESINFLRELAINNNTHVIGGSLIVKNDLGEYKNTCPIISPNGKVITTYDKIHLFSHSGSNENKFITNGNKLKLLTINDTKIGINICYDIRFPELHREYSKAGAEILVNLAAWSKTKPEHWEIMHKARAIENQCFVIAVNQTGKIKENEYNLGHSMVISPWGDTIAELHEEEDSLFCIINTMDVKKLRENFPLLKDRKDKNIKSFTCKEILINE